MTMRLWLNFVALAMLAMLAWTRPALAVPCSDPDSGIFLDSDFTQQAWSDCIDGGDTNDPFPNALNAFGMVFEALEKWLETDMDGNPLGPTTLTDVGFSAAAENSPTGTWSLTDPGLYTDFVIVLKDGGADGPGTDKWSGYLLDTSLFTDFATNGASGWWRYSTDPSKDISHIAIYGKIDVRIPEPGALSLFGIGLLLLGLGRTRRRTG